MNFFSHIHVLIKDVNEQTFASNEEEKKSENEIKDVNNKNLLGILVSRVKNKTLAED